MSSCVQMRRILNIPVVAHHSPNNSCSTWIISLSESDKPYRYSDWQHQAGQPSNTSDQNVPLQSHAWWRGTIVVIYLRNKYLLSIFYQQFIKYLIIGLLRVYMSYPKSVQIWQTHTAIQRHTHIHTSIQTVSYSSNSLLGRHFGLSAQFLQCKIQRKTWQKKYQITWELDSIHKVFNLNPC